MSRLKGSVGAATGMVSDVEINQRAERADRRPARSQSDILRADIRRKKSYTPEYRAWLERQYSKRSARAARIRRTEP